MALPKLTRFTLSVATVAAMLTGCGHAATTGSNAKVTLRLGYLTRITHASALVGIDRGLFVKNLGSGVTFEAQPFEQGTAEATALLAGQIDAAYVGPNPAFNAWQKSGGTAIRIISGSAKGGTSFVVKPGITSAQELRGKTVADPALGGNHDVLLRSWLQDNGLHTNTQGGGDVFIKPTKPESAIVQEFTSNQIAGAVESAPYDVQMVKAGGVKLWPATGTITILVVRQEFLAAHPDAVSGLLRGQVEADQLIHDSPAAAKQAANNALAKNLGKGLDADVLDGSFQETTFTNDPDVASLNDLVHKSVAVGLLKPLTLDGLFDPHPLNDVLKAVGRPQVTS
ncbi:ABC transporter substrate-binding protein [Mycobacterium paraterrae]|uniref:ABC transporter substrate-binding protein n=1 Tax=Mycobacterium paraterrae TaxID=577492 RepID=A0ABY3VRV0_9MYCO|nr:ABC transporter substrate-binding protein [Mycobacterium paraterrae]UMB71338.1 ABC transporter substrate-binding protein [Mycobacterium paraterrae]